MADTTQDNPQNDFYVLVTGANSGVGFDICKRLILDFPLTHPATHHLTIIFTTRSSQKATDTLRRLQTHLPPSSSNTTTTKSTSQITLHPETVDLSNLLSVRALSHRLTTTLPHLDSIILNAGIGGWTGINWPSAIFGVLTDLVHQVTWFTHKVAPTGMVTSPQTTSTNPEPRLGAIFCANVFGHYMLSHNLMPLLHRSTQPGRVIWMSSLEATIQHFNVEDMQGLRTNVPYESSKTLTDILALTADLPSTSPWVEGFYSCSAASGSTDSDTGTREVKETGAPKTYLAHPGICGTGILPLALPLFWAMIAAFWLARMLGSPWHTLSTYAGASAPVWLAVSGQKELDEAEEKYRGHGGGRGSGGFDGGGGMGSWGVVGGAVVEEDRLRRRKRGMRDLTAEEKMEFEELGRKCWRQMEELRVQWEEILEREEREKRVNV
ncbi:3-ketosteroid reductase [Aspergillus sclerotioniger CBS 115572]|uniref:3-ketosteroid reductase n=1 Tax=Aspergillus sclerotioniger CBS 115572 TaxID=1450535 RepID=A0A317X8Z9_9EURO|nr:3-ketosteroid reductase [Aspergillus sclerotioniger CBS 115572]PWY93378.1 3-ketosteroid reductase [Aspergillus sclerotioniger CBS 115572]